MANSSKVLSLTYMALGAALITICSWITIPTTIPFTLQTFAVCLMAGLLGPARGTLSLLVFLFMGMVGLPVFSGFKGGIGSLLGTTGGYLIGFIFTALIVGYLTEKTGNKPVITALVMIFGIAVCYVFGTAWFMFVYVRGTGPVGLGTVMGWCVLPFIIPDIIKSCAAAILVKKLKPFVK